MRSHNNTSVLATALRDVGKVGQHDAVRYIKSVGGYHTTAIAPHACTHTHCPQVRAEYTERAVVVMV